MSRDVLQDLSAIHDVVRQTRRRIRIQAALEGATTAAILATAAALIIIYLLRVQILSTSGAIVLLVAAAAIVGVGALFGALRHDRDEVVAQRVDRASGLDDRLSSALAFQRLMHRDVGVPDGDFMRAAIRDGLRVADRARIVEAAPYRTPRDMRAALGFFMVSLVVAGLALPTSGRLMFSAVAAVVDDEAAAAADAQPTWDLEYPRSVVEQLRKIAKRDHNDRLAQLADALEAQLQRLEQNEIDKEQLLAAMNQAVAELSADGLSGTSAALLGDVREAVSRLRPSRPRVALGTPPPLPPPPPPQNPLTPRPPEDHPGMCTGGDRPPKPGDDPPPPGNGKLGKRGDDKKSGNGGDKAGTEPGGPLAGDPTDRRQPTKDELLQGTAGEGSSRRSAIKTAAKKGFSSQRYKDVFLEYNGAAEDVMQNEKVPASYRYFIKKYFHQIRPSS